MSLLMVALSSGRTNALPSWVVEVDLMSLVDLS